MPRRRAYLDATVKEVLRVRPVLTITSRKTLQPWQVGGHTLPPGVYVSPCLYLAHRRPELWPDPTSFRPERFLDGAPEPYSWVPFGGGTRRCLGASFARSRCARCYALSRRASRLHPIGYKASACAAALSRSRPHAGELSFPLR